MPQESINLDFNFTGSSSGENNNASLIHSLDKLSSKLSGFESAVNKYIQTSNNYNSARKLDPDLIKARKDSAEASKIRAEFLRSAKGGEARKNSSEASLINAQTRNAREKENAIYRSLASESYKSGNIKQGDKYAKLVQSSTAKGVEDGFSKFIKGASIVAGAAFISNALSKNATLNGQITQAVMTNPLLNYDYGSQYANIATLEAQKHYSNLNAGFTVAGGAIGAIAGSFLGSPFAGAGIGASLGDALGSYIGAEGNAKATAKAQALGEFINQRNTTSAMEGTNQAAYNLLSNRKGYTPYSLGGELDPIKPLANEIAKGAAIYNANFKAIDQLTNYVISAQIPLAKLKEFGSAHSQLNLNPQQFQKYANLSSTYGIDPTELANRSIMFMQGGMNKDTALNVAARSFQNVSGFQAYQLSLSQGGYLDRTKKTLLAKYGLNLDLNQIENNNPQELNKLRNIQQKASGKFGVGADLYTQAVLDSLGLTQNTYNINNSQLRKLNDARINPSNYQSETNKMVQDTRILAAKGQFDPSQITASLSQLAGHSTNAANNIRQLADAANAATSMLANLSQTTEGANYSTVKNNNMFDKFKQATGFAPFIVKHYNNGNSLGKNK